MKKETILKRLQKVEINKTTKAYQMLKEYLNSECSDPLRPCWVSGCGRHTKNMDYTEQLKELLTVLKVRYIFGNDAPRGGKCGNFIKIIL